MGAGQSKSAQRGGARAAKISAIEGLVESRRGAPTRDILLKQANEALLDPAAAAKRLNPFADFAAQQIGLAGSRTRERAEGLLSQRGLARSGIGARLLSDIDERTRLDQSRARIEEVARLVQGAPGLGYAGVGSGLGALGVGATAGVQGSAAATKAASQRDAIILQSLLGDGSGGGGSGILGGLVGALV